MRLTILSICLMLVMIGGCGIKPENVDPPAGVQKDSFPKIYPDPQSDPRL